MIYAYLNNVNRLDKISQRDEISQSEFRSFRPQDGNGAINKLPTSRNLDHYNTSFKTNNKYQLNLLQFYNTI